MSRDDNTQFRITTWPGSSVPLPTWRFLQWNCLVDDAGQPQGARTPPTFREPYGEVYLLLADLDLQDDEAVVNFCRRYGALGVYDETWTTLWGQHYFGFPGIPGFDDFVAPALAEQRDELGVLGYDETISEFVWGAQCIKDMTTAWKVHSGQLDLRDAEWVAPCWSETLPDGEAYSWGASPYWVLGRGLESGLMPFGPTIHWVDEEGRDARPGAEIGPHPTHIDLELPLYSILCLELFNHIAENAEYKICANEACGRAFVRQEGRAEHGQHRTSGVKYCTSSCARAQAQRAYRRRKQKPT